MKFKENIDEVRNRMNAYWQGEMLDRAIVTIPGCPLKKGDNLGLFDDEEFKKDKTYLERYWNDAETIHKMNSRCMEKTYFAGDTLPSIFLNFGTSGHCNFYGSKPTYAKSTIWFEPVLESLDAENFVFDENVLNKQIEMVKQLVKFSNGDYFIGNPDSCGTLDALGHLYGSENVLMDMLGEPDDVKNAIKILNEGWVKSNDAFYEVTKDLNQGAMHSWMNLLAPCKMGQMQCDMSVMFSKQQYEEFVKDELQTQIDYFDYPIYHFDGIEQERHLDILLGFEKLKAIQWTDVAGQPPASNYINVLKRIQNAGKNLIIMVTPDEVPVILENLSAKGLNLVVKGVKDKDQADEIVRYVEKNSRA